MNAFKAFKAQAPIAWSPHLYITLVRGIPGTRRLHRRTLRHCVKRLVVIETEEMHKARKQNDVNHRAVRPPLVINHLPASASSS
ncbi:Ribosomal protein [Salix suchowensis]|nr:Ribosomal protein [Salix suchowensis]